MTWYVSSEVVDWSKAFALTVGLEVPIVIASYGRFRPAASAPARAVLAFFAQLASHPAVWFVFPRLGMSWLTMVVCAEVWAVLSETIFYALTLGGVSALPSGLGSPAAWGRAFAISFLANAVSFISGLVVRELTGWV